MLCDTNQAQTHRDKTMNHYYSYEFMDQLSSSAVLSETQLILTGFSHEPVICDEMNRAGCSMDGPNHLSGALGVTGLSVD